VNLTVGDQTRPVITALSCNESIFAAIIDGAQLN
jgi:hypothetical protein